jgi:hypothetical protein
MYNWGVEVMDNNLEFELRSLYGISSPAGLRAKLWEKRDGSIGALVQVLVVQWFWHQRFYGERSITNRPTELTLPVRSFHCSRFSGSNVTTKYQTILDNTKGTYDALSNFRTPCSYHASNSAPHPDARSFA